MHYEGTSKTINIQNAQKNCRKNILEENVGVEAGHLTERGMEKAVRYGNRKLHNWQADRKLKPWREVSHAEQATVQANADALYQKALRENPQLAASNPISRMWQKYKL